MMGRRKLPIRLGRVLLDCFSLSLCTNPCVCVRSVDDRDEEEDERSALVSGRQLQELAKLKDFVDGAAKTLAFHLEPKTVELKVSMHCYGCAKRVQKHIAKMDGVTWFEVDLENKKVMVVGDVTPYEVLESVSKVMRFAELWVAPDDANESEAAAARPQQQQNLSERQILRNRRSSSEAEAEGVRCGRSSHRLPNSHRDEELS